MMNKPTYHSNSKIIFNNTVMLYIRQILVLIVSLYTSRVVLIALGENDYGIYNVVAGFVTMFNIVSGAFSTSIARYMSYSVGKLEYKKVEKILSTSIIVQLILGIILAFIIIILGCWYISNIMVFSNDRLFATYIVLFLSVFSFLINLLSIPYNSLIIAFEKMNVFAFIGFIDAVLKLLVAICIKNCSYDRLIVYGMLMVLDAVIVRALYIIYCKKNFPYIKLKLKFSWSLIKELTAFTGWMFLGNGAVIIRDQGYNMLLNAFSGPAINSARAIAIQVNAGIYGFSSNFMQAVQPQITKLGSTGQKQEMNKMIFNTIKLAWFLMLILCLPVIKNIGYILDIWLEVVPRYTEIFIIFTLLESMINSIINPMLYGILADGKIKVYMNSIFIVNVLSIFITFILLKKTTMPICVYIVSFVVKIIILLIIIWQSKVINNVSISNFLRSVFLPITIVSLFSYVGASFIKIELFSGFVNFIFESLIIEIVIIFSILIGGFSSKEKYLIVKKIQNILQIKK